ncbi:hypothetical protein FRC00_008605 [Tulasnella sp. 408]|nr:hypothetical protein FRC00_008605 [Tulasnella sp. 408]
MTGPAWQWYVQLNPDTAEDWGKLQMAMIDRWPGEGPVVIIKTSPEAIEPINILEALPPPAEAKNIIDDARAENPVVGLKASSEHEKLKRENVRGTEWINIPKALPPPAPELETKNILAPEPAAAPPLASPPLASSTKPNINAANSSFSLNETRTGIIRVDCPGPKTMYIPSYLTAVQGNNIFMPTEDKSEALVVEITQKRVHQPQEIKILIIAIIWELLEKAGGV